MQSLTSRQSVILNRTVDAHIESAQPVGSRLLTQAYDMDFSPATIRTEMGHLEEFGYLAQPHVSAGRIPTDSGYRYYLDHAVLKDVPDGRAQETEMPASLKAERAELADMIVRQLSACVREAGVVLLVETLPTGEKRQRLFLQGSAYLLEKPEFQNIQKLRPVLTAFEERNRLMDALLAQGYSSDIRVSVGHENGLENFHECSVVSGRCLNSERVSGLVAVIGPRRMPYAKIIAKVRQMTVLMNEFFEKGETDFHE